MELISQHTKAIMEGCKERAWDAGLRFPDETLEYIVTNRDLLELHPKVMIPTLYDYWVHDVEVMKEKGKYELYPHNPYETVINTRPPISFYNDNNPDWMNVMIFYHVIGHIDFFQNNLYFRHTWDYDLTGKALADKRLIARLRSEHGRWLDYVIEFARSIDNLVGYYADLAALQRDDRPSLSPRVDYYFDVFLQSVRHATTMEYLSEIGRYNAALAQSPELGERSFFAEVAVKHPEFEALFQKHHRERKRGRLDLLHFIMEHSPFLSREENHWMKEVLEVIRSTSVYFQPQIRTKIMNEGWASYWHEKLFLQDERINGHEVDFARCHANVTALHRIGLNPYAIGMRLFQEIEEKANRGKLSLEYDRLSGIERRDGYDARTGSGIDAIFHARENFCDFTFVQTFVDQEFVDRHKLFVTGKRFVKERMAWQYYVKSRKGEDYRGMLLDSLYHPPSIEVKRESDGSLALIHRFEGKPLVKDFIPGTLLGIEYLWGNKVALETHEPIPKSEAGVTEAFRDSRGIRWRRCRYTMQERTVTKECLP